MPDEYTIIKQYISEHFPNATTEFHPGNNEAYHLDVRLGKLFFVLGKYQGEYGLDEINDQDAAFDDSYPYVFHEFDIACHYCPKQIESLS